MAKNVATNSKGEAGRVLAPTAPQPAVGAEPKPGKAQKDKAIAVAYYGKDENGKPVQLKTPLGTKAIVVRLVDAGETLQLNLAELSPEILQACAAMGLNTILRNAKNTTEHGGGDGDAAVRNRIAALKAGDWTAQGEGEEGTPLVIDAMIRVKKEAGLYVDGMESKWLDHYRSLDKKGKVDQVAEWKRNKLISNAMLKITAERAAERAAKAENAGSQGDAASF